jgi:hypothetical protein
VQLALQPPVLGLQLIQRPGDLPGRQRLELLLPVVQRLGVPAQFPPRLAADHPVLDGGTFKGLVVSFMFGGCVHGYGFPIAHTFIHQLST